MVSGRVQGVCFRAYAQEEAFSLGLAGWVRNLPEGEVEIEAEGPRGAVERLVAWSGHGPPSAYVAGVNVTWLEPQGEPEFRVRYW